MTDREWQLDDRSVAVMLCPFRLCDWQSDDTRTMTPTEQDEVARLHMLDEHREQLDTMAALVTDTPPTPLPEPLWTATDGDHRAHLLDDGPGALMLVIEDRAARRLSVRLPDEALRRGAMTVGRYLIGRTGVGPLRADELRRDLVELAGALDGPAL